MFRFLLTRTPIFSRKLIESQNAGIIRSISAVARNPEEVANVQKLIKIAIIGVPNSGKSTLINKIVNHRICPTSSKVHTTRTASRAVVNKKGAQMIFYDTPGLVTTHEIKKHHLETSFSSASRHSIQHSNIIGVVHDVSNHWTRNQLPQMVLETLKCYSHIPSFLVLNKIDMLRSKRILLELVDTLTMNCIEGVVQKDIKEPQKDGEKTSGWKKFSNIFMVSALTGDGLQDIQNFLLTRAKISPWEFADGTNTDQSSETLIQDTVRARLLDFLPQEIPYNLHTQLEYFNQTGGTIYASVQITCPSPRIEKLVCGEADGKLTQITERVSSDLVETFRLPVSITISTKTSLPHRKDDTHTAYPHHSFSQNFVNVIAFWSMRLMRLNASKKFCDEKLRNETAVL
ncbi:GTPase Era, mitochondrial isoform X2 [Lutzomyia longipalpis]|uniref:GTPase Era, mitochondrial n=1 Tax=Lutzomyia longipalpis TaxID=7200 RepID=A0A1B0CFP8_LUTLO|nr:GTPase Era, mitochondrial isoform X2 [Lutzomyia longipalpis]